MNNLRIFLTFVVYLGLWSGLIAQGRPTQSGKNSPTERGSTPKTDSIPVIDPTGLKEKNKELEKQKDNKAESDKSKEEKKKLEDENKKLIKELEELKKDTSLERKRNREFGKQIIKLKKDLNGSEYSKDSTINSLNQEHAKKIEAFTSKITKIESFVAGETEKLNNEANTLFDSSKPSDSLIIYDKIKYLLSQINILKNLTDRPEKLNALEADVQNFKLLINRFSKAHRLLTKDYAEVKDKIQEMIQELNELPAKRNYPKANKEAEKERQNLLNILKKYCVAYNQAYTFYVRTQGWTNILNKDIETFKADFKLFIKLPLDSFPFINTEIDKLSTIPEKERKKPQNPFKQVTCPNN